MPWLRASCPRVSRRVPASQYASGLVMQDNVDGSDMVHADPPSAARDLSRSRKRFHRLAGVTLGIGLFLLGLWTLHGFLDALVWAAIIAVAVWPAYQAAKLRCPPSLRPIVLPVAFTLAVALIFILPILLFAVQFSHEARSLVDWYDGMRQTGFATPG